VRVVLELHVELSLEVLVHSHILFDFSFVLVDFVSGFSFCVRF